MKRGIYLWIWVIGLVQVNPIFSQTEKILTSSGEILALDGTLLASSPVQNMFDTRFSPDRTQMVFQKEDIWVVDVDGSNLRQLTDGEALDRAPFWSPDGTKIVFQRLQPEGHPLAETGWDLYTINVDGTNLIQLTSLPGFEVRPAWSPDGQEIAFDWSNTGGPGCQIMTISPNGMNLIQLTDFSREAIGPVWSPDGQKILCIANNAERQKSDLYVITRMIGEVVNLTNHPGRYSSFCWSLDGNRIAYTTERNEKRGVYSIQIDGMDETQMIDRDIACSLWFADVLETFFQPSSWGQLKQSRHDPGK